MFYSNKQEDIEFENPEEISQQNPEEGYKSPPSGAFVAHSEESKDFEPSNTKETQSTDVSDDDSVDNHMMLGRGQQLKNILMKKFNEASESSIMTHYLKECENRLQFLRTLHINGYRMLDIKQIKMLWELFAINAFSEAERDLFFNFFTASVFCVEGNQQYFIAGNKLR